MRTEFKVDNRVRRVGKDHWSGDHPIGAVETITKMGDYEGGFYVSNGRYWSEEYAELVTPSDLEAAIKECEDNLQQLRDQLRAMTAPKVGDVFRSKSANQRFRIEFVMGERCAYSKASIPDTNRFVLEGAAKLSTFEETRNYERVS